MRLKLDARPFQTVPEPVTEAGQYQPVSFWQETVSVSPGQPLSEDISCDVCIIGGGFTGLSVAHELKKAAPTLDVVLLERAVVGHGASGRNGGFVMPLLGWDLADAVRRLGEDGAKQAYEFMYGTVRYVKDLVQDNAIPCDMEQTGYLLLATCPTRKKRVQKDVELAQRLGFDVEWLEGDALNGHIHSDAFLGGAFDPHPLIINPAKLARGLKDLVEGLGVRVFEQTSLEELEDGDPVTLRTSQGSVRAANVVLGLNGYGGALGFMPNKILPIHTYIVLTEPLSDGELESVGWGEKRTSLESARNFIHYFRLTADNRILFGGEDANLFYGGKYKDAHPAIFAGLQARFREYFPALKDKKLTHQWGGVLGVALDMFPTCGAGGNHGNIFHAAAYAGHGVSLGNYAGVILAPHILRRAGVSHAGQLPEPFFFGRQPTPFPPEPLRYLGLQAYRYGLKAQDWWQKA